MPRKSREKAGRTRKEKRDGISLKEKFSEALELPKELILDVPRITLIGNRQLFLENYKGIIEYEDNKVRIKTHEGVVSLEGSGILIKEITSEDIMVTGTISSIQFQY